MNIIVGLNSDTALAVIVLGIVWAVAWASTRR